MQKRGGSERAPSQAGRQACLLAGMCDRQGAPASQAHESVRHTNQPGNQSAR